MVCINIDLIHNCNRCKFEYINTSILRNTTVLNITRLISKILWMNGSTKCSIYNKIKYHVTVTCTGNIDINRDNKVIQMNEIQAMELSYKFLDSWRNINTNNIKEDYNDKMLQLIQVMKNTDNIYKIRDECIKLVKYIENIELGNRISNITYYSLINIASTYYSLSDVSALSKFTSLSLVQILTNVVYHIKYLKLSTLFINLDVSYITCIGELSISPNLVSCNCTVKTMKAVYSKYLNTWCKNNFMQYKEIEKIKRSIDISNRIQNLNELYNNCINLSSCLNYSTFKDTIT